VWRQTYGYLQGITAHWLVPNYTASWQRHLCVNNLPIVLNSPLCGVIWKFLPWLPAENRIEPYVTATAPLATSTTILHLSRLFNLSVSTGNETGLYSTCSKSTRSNNTCWLSTNFHHPSSYQQDIWEDYCTEIHIYIQLFSLPHPHLPFMINLLFVLLAPPLLPLFPSFTQSPLSLLPTPMLLSLPWISARLLIPSVTQLSFKSLPIARHPSPRPHF